MNGIFSFHFLMVMFGICDSCQRDSCLVGFPGGAGGKEPPANARDIRDVGLIPGSRRSPGEENGYPLQYSCLGNSTDRGAWWALVHGVADGLN